MLNNLGKNEKLLLSVVIGAGILYLFLNFLFIPSITSINAKNLNISDYKNQLQIIEVAKGLSTKLKSQLITLQAKEAETLKQLPTANRIPEIARNIKPLVDKSGVVFGPISFGKSAENVLTVPGKLATASKSSLRLMSFPVTLSESGDYLNIMKFIDSLENDSRITQVDDVGLAQLGSGLQASIAVHYYFVTSAMDSELKYDFNNGAYGKVNFFK